MITKMITDGRFGDSTLPPGATFSDTIFVSPPLSLSYPTQSTHPTQSSYPSASTLPPQFQRIHARSFFPNQTLSTVSATNQVLDIATRTALFTLFFIMSCFALFSLIYFVYYIRELYTAELQQQCNYESDGELERLIIRRTSFGYHTFDEISPYEAEENGRPVSSTGRTENREHINATRANRGINATKATQATKAKATKITEPSKPTKTTKTINVHHTEPESETAHSTHPTPPNRRKVVFGNLPRPIRRPPTSKKPAVIQFAASASRPSRLNKSNPPRRLRSPPLPPDFLTMSNATTAPMTIPGQEPSSWTAGLPWATAADDPNTRDEGKRDREMSPDDEDWGDVDRIISNERDQYAGDKKILDEASRRDRQMKRVNGGSQSRDECDNFSSSSEGFWGY
ncbi:uncharacterized protein EAF01_001129 [Botrytis porri]|uniref:Uncharacterized protein n=1 Tax=Botrytis porri TaxID=87229 RepID=A0A4Z1KUM8_9HELO|nr:uncharacterized protein EAF01_001129 [Botrytis porri]KAF7912108.1 hypothetical protein EAF01_001129 [Botrytis porri]TGO88229.1 hypothetical protein BPOR_0175g00030 [Botrytis porri]